MTKNCKGDTFIQKGDESLPSNYSPVFLLGSIVKFLRNFCTSEWSSFFTKHNLFTPAQYGFRPKYSCSHAIAEITDFIRYEIDKKSNGIACFIDLQKACDAVNYKMLLVKLSSYGFSGPIYNIMDDYLSSRSQYVIKNGNRCDIAEIVTGDPQGSVLGSFLFLVYINDFTQTFQNDQKSTFCR